MRKIAQILLGGFANKLLGKLTDQLLNPPNRSRTPRKSSSKTTRPDKPSHLDAQLDELAKVYITKQTTKKKVNRKTDPPTLSQNNEYWTELSNWYRKKRGWSCEKCNLNLKNDKKFLDTHHILGRGYNSPEHLKALCVGCHAEQKTPSDHSFMKNEDRYRKFMRTYRRRR